MMIILNPKAGGDRAMERWERFRSGSRRPEVNGADIVMTSEPCVSAVVTDALSRGERRFVAAGGDGTVNSLLNALMEQRDAAGFRDVALGAIGLGSSNDFHKTSADRPPSPPVRIDFLRVRRRDVGCVEAAGPAGPVRRYFLVNASLGVTAEGNELFNRTAGIVASFKRIWAGGGIAAAALLAIARHSNVSVRVSIDAEPDRAVLLSNLAVLKNPNISGSLRMPVGSATDDGRLGIWIEDGLSRIGLLSLFIRLASGGFTPGNRSILRRCAILKVAGSLPFPVEYDGEILHTNDVTFSVLPGAIGVCQ